MTRAESRFFVKEQQICEVLTWWTKKKRREHKLQNTHTRNKKELYVAPPDMKRIREYNGHIYTDKFESLEEMDKFLEKQNFPQTDTKGDKIWRALYLLWKNFT